MANEFNSFFSEIAENILNDIPASTAKPEECKPSLDIDSFNSNLLKSVKNEIASPLSFIFNLSF